MASPLLFFLLSVAMLIVDIVTLGLALLLAFDLRFHTDLFAMPVEMHIWSEYWPLILLQSMVFGLVFAGRGMYRIQRNASKVDELQRVFLSVLIAGGLTLGVIALGPREIPFSRLVVLMAWISAVPMLWIARIVQYWLHGQFRRFGLGVERVLVVGDGPVAYAVLEKLHHGPAWGYQVAGYVSGPVASGRTSLNGSTLLGTLEELDTVVAHNRITEVIVAEPSLDHQHLLNTLERLDPRNVTVKVFPDEFQLLSTQVTLSDLNGLPLISIRDAALQGWRSIVKRIVDAVVSALVLVFLSPLLLLLALLIKLSSPTGPVFFMQERIGLDGRHFWVIKFRSMRPDAEAGSGPVWATRNDPRATPVGRFLRRFSLDELPQFINVLLGDMSIVGPRPERPEFVEEFRQRIPNYWARHRQKVGLTGWAQVNGLRGDTSIEERTAYDLWYVENWSLWLDFKIMIRTIPVIFRHSNG